MKLFVILLLLMMMMGDWLIGIIKWVLVQFPGNWVSGSGDGLLIGNGLVGGIFLVSCDHHHRHHHPVLHLSFRSFLLLFSGPAFYAWEVYLFFLFCFSICYISVLSNGV